MEKLSFFVLAALLFALLGCASTNGALFNEQGILTLEAENMTLTDGEVVTVEGASGGKAVKVLTDKTVGTIQFTLPAGEYVVNTYMGAPDGDHDAFYILVDENLLRVYPPIHDYKWTYSAKFLNLKIEKSGSHTFTFASNREGQKPGEAGMVLDHFEIVKAKKWINPIK
jgi:hypothetical protein